MKKTIADPRVVPTKGIINPVNNCISRLYLLKIPIIAYALRTETVLYHLLFFFFPPQTKS